MMPMIKPLCLECPDRSVTKCPSCECVNCPKTWCWGCIKKQMKAFRKGLNESVHPIMGRTL